MKINSYHDDREREIVVVLEISEKDIEDSYGRKTGFSHDLLVAVLKDALIHEARMILRRAFPLEPSNPGKVVSSSRIRIG